MKIRKTNRWPNTSKQSCPFVFLLDFAIYILEIGNLKKEEEEEDTIASIKAKRKR